MTVAPFSTAGVLKMIEFRNRLIPAVVLVALASLSLSASPVLSEDGPKSRESVLSRDARLRKRLSVPEGELTTLRLFGRVERATSVRLYAGNSEMKNASLTAACRSQTALALLDAVSALWVARWEKDTANRYKLLGSEAEESIYLGDNGYQRERLKAGRQFIKELGRLPPPAQSALLSGVPASSLPPGMLGTVRTMVDALNRESREFRGDTNPFPLHRLAEATAILEPKNRGAVTSFFLTLRLKDWGSMGWSFNNYVAPAQRDAKYGETTYVPRKFEVTQKEARKLPALRKLVSLRVKKATLPQVLEMLHRTYSLAYVSDSKTNQTHRADVNFDAIPLGDALDQLAKIYAGTEWEYRKLGFLVIRSAGNPAQNISPTRKELEEAS